MLKDNKILNKFLILINVDIDNVDFNNIDSKIQNLDDLVGQIIIQFKKMYFFKKNQNKILFYFDKNFELEKYKKDVDFFINYLNEFNIFVKLIKDFDNLNYGTIISKTNKLLLKAQKWKY